ncbi:MAG: hypothetical protein ACR2OM_10725 [Aestuariivirgaceae bacterium]
MTRIIVVMLSLFILWRPAAASAGEINLPQPLHHDADLFNLYWTWVKAQTGAPPGLPAPLVSVEPLPSGVKMALFFPTANNRQRSLRIAVSPQAIDRAAAGARLQVIGELAHELVHYVLLLSENGWRHRSAEFINDVHHHCDHTFQRLTRHVATILWNAYHSSDVMRGIDHMVQLSCWEDGHRLATRG